MCTEGRFKRISHEESGGKQYPAGNVAWEVRNFRVCFFQQLSFFLIRNPPPLPLPSPEKFGTQEYKKVLPVNRLH